MYYYYYNYLSHHTCNDDLSALSCVNVTRLSGTPYLTLTLPGHAVKRQTMSRTRCCLVVLSGGCHAWHKSGDVATAPHEVGVPICVQLTASSTSQHDILLYRQTPPSHPAPNTRLSNSKLQNSRI